MSARAQLQTVWHSLVPGVSNQKLGPIGLDFAMNAIHLVQLQYDNAGRIVMRASATQTFEGGRDSLFAEPVRVRSVVQDALRKGAFKGRQVVTVLPAPGADIFPLSYKVATGQSDSAAVYKALSDRLEGDMAELVIDYVPVRIPDSEDRMALVAVAQRDTVLTYLELLRSSGLHVDCLEVGPVAIRRFVRTIGRIDSIDNVMTVNFGQQASFITVISGRRLLMDQQVSFGEDDLIAEIATALDIQPEQVPAFVKKLQRDTKVVQSPEGLMNLDDAAVALKEILTPCFLRLVDEINRVLIYTASQTRGESVHRIYLLGSLARWQWIDQFLNDLIHVDVETIPNPLSAFTLSDLEEDNELVPAPELAVATGLGLHGMLPDDEI